MVKQRRCQLSSTSTGHILVIKPISVHRVLIFLLAKINFIHNHQHIHFKKHPVQILSKPGNTLTLLTLLKYLSVLSYKLPIKYIIRKTHKDYVQICSWCVVNCIHKKQLIIILSPVVQTLTSSAIYLTHPHLFIAKLH